MKISYGEYGIGSYKKIELYWNRNIVGKGYVCQEKQE